MQRHPPQTETEVMRYVDMIFVVQANIRWRNANEEDITYWLKEVVPTLSIARRNW